MEVIPRILGMASAVLFFFGAALGATEPEQKEATVVVTEVPGGFAFVTTTSVDTPTTTTTVYMVPPTARCGQWWGLAIEAGWQTEELETLDYVMWKESRCDPTQHNTTRNRDGSTDVGLTQVNDRSWCLPTRWYPGGYLQTIEVLASVGCEELFDPFTNLRAAKAIHDYAKQTSDDGFATWGI
jgi:hypothetical protein